MSDAVKTDTGANVQKPKAAPAIQSAVPKARLVMPASIRQFVATPKIRGAMLLIVMIGFFSLLFFGIANTAYNKRRDAEIPSKRIALSDTVSGIEASNLVVGGIFNARREIVACLPIQYPISQQIFKLLGKKGERRGKSHSHNGRK